MSKKMTYKIIIEDCTKTDSCTQAELEALIGLFEHNAKQTSSTFARKAWFDLTDFAIAKQKGVDRFSLLLMREQSNGKEKWIGKFEYGSKCVKIVGVLEDVIAHETQSHGLQK